MMNEFLAAMGLCLLIWYIYMYWQESKVITTEDNKMEKEIRTTTPQLAVGTRELFMETLTKIGCQYEMGDGDNNRIYFAYQGEYFVADACDEMSYVHLWDTHWAHVELYDVDELSRLKKAINLSNLNCAATTVYTIDEAGGNVDVHCKSTILFVPQIPELDNYLRGELNDFFRAHQYIGNEMVKQREEESV
jgi:hypothetical protein